MLKTNRIVARITLLLVLGGVSQAGLVRAESVLAQEEEKPWKQPPVFAKLFAKPTGENGYEELVQAVDLVSANEQVWRLTARRPTLTEQRRLLGESSIQKALALLRTGLGKPCISPIQNPGIDTPLPHLAGMRTLVQVMKMQAYVSMADGRTAHAIDTVYDGLRLGYRVQQESVLSGLVGVACLSIAFQTIAPHLEQLSAGDCERLIRLLTEYLQAPSPQVHVLEQEKQFALRTLEKLKHVPDPVRELATWFAIDDENPEEADATFAATKNFLAANPGQAEALFNRTRELMVAQMDWVIAEAHKPYYAQQPVPSLAPENPVPTQQGKQSPAKTQDTDLAAELAEMMLPVYAQIGGSYARTQAQAQLLLVHTAIRRYRWEHSQLPAKLDQLKPFGVDEALLIDPFTGQPLHYERKGDNGYDLYSVGPPQRDDKGKLIPGKTKMVRLPGITSRP